MEILAVLTLLFGYAVMRHLDAQKNRDRQHPVGTPVHRKRVRGNRDPFSGPFISSEIGDTAWYVNDAYNAERANDKVN